MTVEELVEHVRFVALERIRPEMEPDDDWQPVLFLWNGSLEMHLFVFANERREKEAAMRRAAELIASSGAWLAAMVNTAWMTTRPKEGVRPTDDPDRIEVLLIDGYDWAGNEASWLGQISRGPGPPVVAELEPFDRHEGLFPQTFRLALAANAHRVGAGPN